jgi:hypothetical protein
VRIWPYDRAEGGNTIDVLRRLRAEIPTGLSMPTEISPKAPLENSPLRYGDQPLW